MRRRLLDEWVLVSPHRMKRPWSGQIDPPEKDNIAEYDPKNPLCPGNTRSNGEKNPDYDTTFVFPNDFPAILTDTPEPPKDEKPKLFKSAPVRGECKVICFHPKTNVTLAKMNTEELNVVVDAWVDQAKKLDNYKWVQIFENRGKMMGCSNPHPHCQIWATDILPTLPEKADNSQRKYFKDEKVPMLEDYCKEELSRKERIVVENDHWVVVIPYWATWPYQTLVLPKFAMKRIQELGQKSAEKVAFGSILNLLTIKYDNLFKCNFPYSGGFYSAPNVTQDDAHWTFHGHFYPPLLRSASVRKFMVGFEMLGMPQRDLTAEQAAKTLRELPDIHYTKQ